MSSLQVFFLLAGEFSRLHVFSQSCKARPSIESLLFVFPRELKFFVFSPKPAKLDRLSAHVHNPSAKVCSHHLWRCTGSQPRGRTGWSTWSIGGAHGPVEGFIEKVSQTTHGQASWWRLWHFHHALMSSKVLVAMLPASPNLSAMLIISQSSWWSRKEVGLLVSALHIGEGRCSFTMLSISFEGETGLRGSLGTELSCLGKGVMQVK